MARIGAVGGNSIVDPTFSPNKMQAGAQKGANSIVDPTFSPKKAEAPKEQMGMHAKKAEAPKEKPGMMQTGAKTKNALGGKFDMKA